MPSLPIDDENLPLFTVGQVSVMLEVQQAFLRRLDQKGVVSPSRSEGKQRRYSRREITVVQYVVELADQGVSLAGIRRILQLEAQVRQLEQQCAALRAQLRRTWSRKKSRPSGQPICPPRLSGTMSRRTQARQLIAGLGPRGCSSMVERQLPKLIVRVRFPSPAPYAEFPAQVAY